jgi:glycosyltransferase involved in cell wall biosynthesis
MKNTSIDVITPYIPQDFKKKEKPSKPIIAIHTREPRDTAKIIKTFYLRFPQYRWITFRDMRGIKQEDFAKFLQESYVSVWVDNESGFGTYPIESMVSGTPVIGRLPNLKPEWLMEENGIWTYEVNDLVEILANFTQNWLEDNISESLYQRMEETSKAYTDYSQFENETVKLFNEYFEVRSKMFSEQLEKINVTE